MNRAGRSLLVVLVGFNILAIIAAVGYSFGEGLSREILRTFLGDYVRARYLVILLEYALAIQATILLLYGSLFLKRRVISPGALIVVAIIMAGLYALLVAAVQPEATARYQEIWRHSKIALEESKKARAALGIGQADAEEKTPGQKDLKSLELTRLKQAKRHLAGFLEIDGENENALRMLQAVEAAIEGHRPAAEIAPPEGPADATLSVRQLVNRSYRYLEDGDPFTAHYFASRAVRIAPGSSAALKARADAERRMSELVLTDEEKRTQRVFRTKQAGREALEQGRPQDAYYILKGLSLERPGDSELGEFVAAAHAKVSETAFFTDEVPERGIAAAQISNMAIALQGTGIDRRVIFAGTATSAAPTRAEIEEDAPPPVVYLRDVEVIEFGRTTVTTHVRTPLAKLKNKTILLKALDPTDQDAGPTPVYRVGSDERGSIPFPADPAVLYLLSLEGIDLRERSLPELWALRRVAPDGTRIDIDVELMMRALMPFLMLIVSIVALPFGVRFAPKSRVGLTSICLLPVLLLAAHVGVQVVLIFTRIVVSYLAVTQGSLTAIVALGVGVGGAGVYATSRANLTASRIDQ